MDDRVFTVSLHKNPRIVIEVTPGHFTTSNSHVSCYLDMSNLKSSAPIAKDVAKEVAVPYLSSTLVNTIVCMDKTEVIGAYLAEELLQQGTAVMNSGGEIHVITPMSIKNGKLIFQSNLLKLIINQSIILLVDSVSGGRTVNSATECIDYYGGKLAGISALFCASAENSTQNINALFTSGDIPGYRFFTSGECVMCKEGRKLEAIINSAGYTEI